MNNIPTMQTLIVMVLLIALAPATQAGVNDQAAKAVPMQLMADLSLANNKGTDEDKNLPDTKRGKNNYSLRCWQYGRLIFEEAIAAPPPDVIAGSAAFPGKSDQKTTLYLLDTKGGATCLIK